MHSDLNHANHKWSICGDYFSPPPSPLSPPVVFTLARPKHLDSPRFIPSLFLPVTSNMHLCVLSDNPSSVQLLHYTRAAPRAARRLRPSAQSAVLFSAPPSQEAILDIKRIRVSYLRTWFIPDVIAAFPIGYILLFAVIMNTTAAAAAAADSRVVHSL